MDESYNKKLQDLTSRVKRIQVSGGDTTTNMPLQSVPSSDTDIVTQAQGSYNNGTSSSFGRSLKKYFKYSYALVPIIGLILYIAKPKLITKLDKNTRKQIVSVPKLTIALLVVAVAVFGLSIAVKKFT